MRTKKMKTHAVIVGLTAEHSNLEMGNVVRLCVLGSVRARGI